MFVLIIPFYLLFLAACCFPSPFLRPLPFLLKNRFWFYSKVIEVFTKAAEYLELPVRRIDEEHLQRLFILVRSELNLDLKNIRQEQAKFLKQHPAIVKVTFSPSVFFNDSTDHLEFSVFRGFILICTILSTYRQNY